MMITQFSSKASEQETQAKDLIFAEFTRHDLNLSQCCRVLGEPYEKYRKWLYGGKSIKLIDFLKLSALLKIDFSDLSI